MLTTTLAGTLGLVVVLLWLRGYWHFDQFVLRLSPTEYYAFSSTQGCLLMGRSNDPALPQFFGASWTKTTFAWSDWDATNGGPPVFAASAPMYGSRLWIPWLRISQRPFVVPAGTNYVEIIVPYWMIVSVLAVLATAPWLRWQFSLRAMLGLMTALAIFLGITIVVN